MKKLTLLLFFSFVIAFPGFAQNYEKYMQKGKAYNRLFTEQLLKYLSVMNSSFQEIFRKTRQETLNVSNKRQNLIICYNIWCNLYLNRKLD